MTNVLKEIWNFEEVWGFGEVLKKLKGLKECLGLKFWRNLKKHEVWINFEKFKLIWESYCKSVVFQKEKRKCMKTAHGPPKG